MNGENKCSKCHEGFHLEDNKCVCTIPNICSCTNGTPTTGTKCHTNGASICSECDWISLRRQ